jgi:hypothetical protein
MKSAGRAEALGANINCIYLACQCQAGKDANGLSGIFVTISLAMYSRQNSGRYTGGNFEIRLRDIVPSKNVFPLPTPARNRLILATEVRIDI